MPRGVYPRKKRSLADRFWEKVSIGGPDECWPFLGYVGKASAGQILNEAGELEYTNRVAYRLAKGPIPDGFLICHSCDNPPCCNPAHLWIGTHQHNSQDAEQKGRLRHYWPKYGPGHPTANISQETRLLILSDTRPTREVSRELGLLPVHVHRIRYNAQRKARAL